MIFSSLLYFNVCMAKILKKILHKIEKLNRILINKSLLAQFERHEKIEKLNVGCGPYLVKGWLNIDQERLIPQGRLLKDVSGILMLNVDVNNLDCIVPGSIRYIYASHFIEHLTHKDAINFLNKAYKWMMVGGVIRLTTPDLGLWIKKYYENDLAFFMEYHSLYLRNDTIRTKGEIFMAEYENFGHKWIYDFEALKNIMNNAGFSRIQQKMEFDSLIPEIKEVEPKCEGRDMETFYIEAQKE